MTESKRVTKNEKCVCVCFILISLLWYITLEQWSIVILIRTHDLREDDRVKVSEGSTIQCFIAQESFWRVKHSWQDPKLMATIEHVLEPMRQSTSDEIC